MSLPNVNQQNQQQYNNNDNASLSFKKRTMANESKGMDEILGSNISKGYGGIGKFLPENRGLPLLNQNENKVNSNSATFPSREMNNGRPISQDKRQERQARDILDMYKAQSMGMMNEQSDRMETLERTLKFLTEQMGGFEKMLYNETRRNKSYFDTEKEHIDRLETNLKVHEDNISLINNDVVQKINLLEARLMREEKAKLELRDKLGFAEQNQRELLDYVKSLQHQENHELNQMRSILQEKLTEDQGFAIKEKERSKTLFHEVVRLGEQQERSAEVLQNLNLALEAKVQAMETKFQVNERALMALTERGQAGLTNLGSWNEQFEKKFQSLESNIYSLTREQVKDKEVISKLEAINAKLSDDLAQLLNNLNNDYQQKLDIRVTELVNRIVMEHEERVKNHEDFKQAVNIKDQIHQERTQYEREEMRERYNAMDSLVRAEFERKDEAIRSLHNIVETQVRALQAGLKQEELARNQFEGFLRDEMGRFQDEVKKEFDGFRQQQTVTTEKLTEMIKIEIDTRLSSDIELKNQINTIAHNISQDIEILKENLEGQIDGVSKELRTVAADSAERANQLSRYIDQEVANVTQNFNGKYEKLKVLFAKFGEQFKNHLLNTEAFRKETLTKVQEIEQTMEFNKEEARSQLIDLEKRLEEKFREQRELMATTIDNNNKVLEDKMNKVKEQEEGDVEVLKEAIENNRTIFNNKIEKLMELNDTYHKNVTNTLAKVLADLDNVKSNTFTLKNELHSMGGAFSDDINDLRGYLENQLLTERTIRSQLIEETYESLKNNINDINSSINLLRVADERFGKMMDDLEKRYDDRFHTFSERLAEAFLKLAKLNDNLANFEEKAKEDHIQLVSRMTADNALLTGDTKMLFGELKRVVDLLSQENNKTKNYQEKMTDYLVGLSKESEVIRKKVEDEILKVVDSKVGTILERLKKEDQDLWEKTLHHVNNNFKEASQFTNGVKIPPQGKLHELVTQDDTYQRPTLKNAPGTNKQVAQPQAQAQQQPVNKDKDSNSFTHQYQQNPQGQVSAMPSKR